MGNAKGEFVEILSLWRFLSTTGGGKGGAYLKRSWAYVIFFTEKRRGGFVSKD